MDKLFYLGAHDIRSLALGPSETRDCVLDAFRNHARGLNRSLPKASLDIGPGHGFQAMAAASEPDGIATLKWVSMAPVDSASKVAGINAVICVNDYRTGVPLAIMDGNEITLIRTAAMSAAAAAFLAPEAPAAIGMIGCGLQAYAHLAAFADLFPGLKRLVACSRSRGSAEKLAEKAREAGFAAEVAETAQTVLETSDIVISMVPGAPGLKPFLDARLLKRDAFVSAVDIGRSWLPESFPAFDLRVTDSLAQSKAPYDVHGKPVQAAPFHTDLVTLCGDGASPSSGRRLFCFRGFALADLAVANLAFRKARKCRIGTELPR